MRDLILIAHFFNQKALEIRQGTDQATVLRLSPREIDALTMLAIGYSRAQAADKLSISEHTLRVYIESAQAGRCEHDPRRRQGTDPGSHPALTLTTSSPGRTPR